MFNLKGRFFACMITLFIIGTCSFIGGLGYQAYSYLRFRNWVEVTAQCTDLQCHTHRTKHGTETLCQVQYDYAYNGDEYTTILEDHSPTQGKSQNIFVSPQHPEQSIDRIGNESFASFMSKFGLVLALITGGLLFYSKRRGD